MPSVQHPLQLCSFFLLCVNLLSCLVTQIVYWTTVSVLDPDSLFSLVPQRIIHAVNSLRQEDAFDTVELYVEYVSFL